MRLLSALLVCCFFGSIGLLETTGRAEPLFPLAVGCPAAQIPEVEAIRVQRNIPYATLDGTELHLDIYAPAVHSDPLPSIVLLHGGGWRTGNKASLARVARALAAQGYAVIPVEYRLSSPSGNHFPAAVQDVRCAVKWLKSQATTQGIDSQRIAAAGGSAGGHLSSMLGVEAELDSPDCAIHSETAKVQGVVSISGPQDLRPGDTPPTREQEAIVTNFLGVKPQDNPLLAAQASPITYVSDKAPPFLLLHGTGDQLVPIDQARRMQNSLQASGRSAQFIAVEDAGHDLTEMIATGAYPELWCEILGFLRRTLRTTP